MEAMGPVADTDNGAQPRTGVTMNSSFVKAVLDGGGDSEVCASGVPVGAPVDAGVAHNETKNLKFSHS